MRSILDDLCRIARVHPEVRVAAARQRRAEVPAYWGSGRKAEAELAWRPEIPWITTLEDLYEDALAALAG